MHRIVVITAGTRGDVQPYVALGQALQETGCRVRLVTHPDFRNLVEEAGLAFASLGVSLRPHVEGEAGRRIVERGHKPHHLLGEIFRTFLKHADTVMDRMVTSCSDADLVVFSPLGFPAYHVAEARNIPAVAAYLQPLTPTRAFPAPVGSVPRWLRNPLLNRWTYHVASLFSWWMVRKPSNRLRKRLGLRPLGLRGPFPAIRRQGLLHLYAFSPHVVPRPPDWPPWARITGYWFRKVPPFRPPEDLERFLANRKPVVYVGFGSMRLSRPEKALESVLAALEAVDAFGVMGAGWSGLSDLSHPRVYFVREIPHEWLFPRVDVVVHHGGAGTTAMGLRFGRPTVIVPFLADQFFWGERVTVLGAGCTLGHVRNLTADRLAQALRAVLSPGVTDRARTVGMKIQKERGLESAVEEILERLSARGSS